MIEKPLVSIIIPVYNNLKFTLECVDSIYRNLPKFPVEVIVVGKGNDGTEGAMRDLERKKTNLKFVQNNSNQFHFAANANLGAEVAKNSPSKFILFLNNDVIVTPGWLDQLVSCFNRIKNSPHQVCPPPAAIGPCSNYVMQHQAIALPNQFNMSRLDSFSQEVAVGNRGQWLYASVISGFCLMVDKDIFFNIGGFDESFVNGNEDVDLCLKLAQAGYSCVVDRATFVFHHGSQTLAAGFQEIEDTKSGTKNRVQLVQKWFGDGPREQRISGNVRLKCSKEELERWLQRHYELFDFINIVDDDSGWPMDEYLKAWPKCHYVNGAGKIEVDQRQKLYEMSLAQGADWMVVLDHDEFFEDKVTRETLQHLANLPLPGCVAYVARWIHLWNSTETYNVKYPPPVGVFMRKITPNLGYHQGSPNTSLHCSRIPTVPVVGSAHTNIHILHYGYVSADLRKRKRQWYESIDPNPDPHLVGGFDYGHLTRQVEISISEWRGSHDYTIALTAMTEKEEPYQVQMLLESIGSTADELIFRTNPGNPVIPLLKLWGAKVIEKEWENNYSKFRNMLIDQAKSAYILVMDIDESLQDPVEITRLVELQPTAVMFTVQNLQPNNRPPATTEVMRLFQNRPDIRFNGILHETIEDDMNRLKVKMILRAAQPLIHYGFLKKRLPEKLKNYVKLNRKALHVNPWDPKPYFNLALHFLEEGEIQQAIDHFQTAITLHPKFTLAKLELAKVYVRFANAMVSSAMSDIPEQHPLKRPVAEFQSVLLRLVPPGESLMFPPFTSLAPERKRKK